jgi:hypothetical protein
MKSVHFAILSVFVVVLGGCSYFDARQSPPDPLAIPVGKNWQIVEEPPKLSDDSGRLPFQKEQSVQPDVSKPVLPEKKRTIETPL